jgi:hypothetical protein
MGNFMKKMILAFLVMVMFLVVGKANADGAWILWLNQGESWTIVGGYPSYNLCIQEEVKVSEEKARGFPMTICKKEAGCHALEYRGNSAMNAALIVNIGWVCLPESVDPRK